MLVMVRRGMRSAALALVWVIAAGCGGGASDSESGRTGDVEPETASNAAGLTATVQRSTLFETRRSLRLTVRSDREEDRVIRAVQLESPLFEPVEPGDRNTRVPPAGRRVVMPLPFGTTRCDRRSGSGDTGQEDTAVLLADADGQAVRVPIEQRPSDLLGELHGTECAAAAVLADVDLRLGDTWRPSDPRTLEGELEFSQRRDGADAAVQGVEGNVIFTVSGDAASPRALAVSNDRPSASAPIAITASRCDPHALIEYKRTFIFTASIQVDSAEPARVDIKADGAARRALEDLLTSCLG
jgi:hypothetical protein